MPDKTETQTSLGPCGDIIVLDQPAGKTDAGFEDEKVPKFGLPPTRQLFWWVKDSYTFQKLCWFKKLNFHLGTQLLWFRFRQRAAPKWEMGGNGKRLKTITWKVVKLRDEG